MKLNINEREYIKKYSKFNNWKSVEQIAIELGTSIQAITNFRYKREYYLTHKERLNILNKKWKKSHPDYMKEYLKNWSKTKQNSSEYSEYRKKWNEWRRNHWKEKKLEIIRLLGGKCSNPNCLVIGGCNDVRCLQIDHINGGGVYHSKRRGTGGVWLDVLKEIKSGNSKNYQLLCANCNWIKKSDKNENPKEKWK